MKATHEITARYFPGKGEVDLSWRDVESGETAHLTTKVPEALGARISRVVAPCVYSGAVRPTQVVAALYEKLDELVRAMEWVRENADESTVARNTIVSHAAYAVENARRLV